MTSTERLESGGIIFLPYQGVARPSRLSGDPFACLPLGRDYPPNELEIVAPPAS